MIKNCLVFALAAVLVACCLPGACANKPAPYQWGLDDFTKDDPNGPCIYRKHCEQRGGSVFGWDYGLGPEAAYDQWGYVPEDDPIVDQTFRNLTQTPWTDWHVDLTNGYIEVGNENVYNVARPTPPWVVEYIGLYDNGTKAIGFFAHVVTGAGTEVQFMEKLNIYFLYSVIDPGQPVTISQYPTTTWPIPEPASVTGLVIGLVGLGIRRRVR